MTKSSINILFSPYKVRKRKESKFYCSLDQNGNTDSFLVSLPIILVAMPLDYLVTVVTLHIDFPFS
jgi:hypothetical protein